MIQASRFLRQVGILPFLILASICIHSCETKSESEETLSDRDINSVMDAHVEELMAIEGVTGVAVGALDDGTPSILILIMEESDELSSLLPSELEGHPVRTMVSGEIKPMQDGASDTTR